MPRRCEHTGKTIYDTRRDARTFINAMPHKQLREYQCPLCGHYHLTHKEQEKSYRVYTVWNKEFLKYMDSDTTE